MSENAKHVAEEIVEEVEEIGEEQVPPTRRQRFKNWVKSHKIQIGVGAGTAVLAGAVLAAKKTIKDRTGLDLGGEIADVVEGVTPPEI